MANTFQQLLGERSVLLADGATGTNLFALGLATGEPPELWNADHPDRVKQHYQRFVDAGSDVFLTNSFGGTHYRLALHGSQDRVVELNETAARLAREVADAADRPVAVGGSMGPTGELFQPLGALTHEGAVDAFRVQAEALARGGVDVLWIETLSAQEEVDAAVEAARSTGLPVVCTVSIDTNGRTMMGITPHGFAAHCDHAGHGPDAFGTNCGVGASELVTAIVGMRAAVSDEALLVAKANCGIPEWQGDQIVYNGTPALMAEYAVLARDAGARIVGGCCGTTPDHIRAMRAALDSRPVGSAPDLETITSRLGDVSHGAQSLYAGEASAGTPSRGSGRRRGRTAT
jgi:5-methyltetrahydrofolate--homocysteine methyltransferase